MADRVLGQNQHRKRRTVEQCITEGIEHQHCPIRQGVDPGWRMCTTMNLAGMLLQQRPTVTFSDDSISLENELGDFGGGDGDHYSYNHATPSQNSHCPDTGQKGSDLCILLQEQQRSLQTIITNKRLLKQSRLL